MEMKDQVEKRLKEGWIKSWMMIEALAINQDTAKSALEKHVERMKKEAKVLMYKTEFGEVKKVQKPFQNIPEAYSQVVEIELLTQDYEKLVTLAINYGPSAIEILSPENIKMDMGEAQGILNALAALIHRVAAMGSGGIMIST
jgi:hypothetical protein